MAKMPESHSDPLLETIKEDIESFWPELAEDPFIQLGRVARFGRAMKGYLTKGIGQPQGLLIGTVPQLRLGHSLDNKITLALPGTASFTLEYHDADDSLHVFQNGKEVPEEDLKDLAPKLAESLQGINLDAVTLVRD